MIYPCAVPKQVPTSAIPLSLCMHDDAGRYEYFGKFGEQCGAEELFVVNGLIYWHVQLLLLLLLKLLRRGVVVAEVWIGCIAMQTGS